VVFFLLDHLLAGQEVMLFLLYHHPLHGRLGLVELRLERAILHITRLPLQNILIGELGQAFSLDAIFSIEIIPPISGPSEPFVLSERFYAAELL